MRAGRYDASFLSIFPVGDPTEFIPDYQVPLQNHTDPINPGRWKCSPPS